MVGREADEHIKSDHGRRQHDRQRDQGLEHGRDTGARRVQPVRQRQPDGTEHQRGDGRELQREPKRLPERRGQAEKGGGGVGHGGISRATFNAERSALNAQLQPRQPDFLAAKRHDMTLKRPGQFRI
jgi:hypothetical protein